MIPFCKFLYTYIRLFSLKLFSGAKVVTSGFQILSYNSRFCFGKNSTIALGNRVISDGRFVIVTGQDSYLSIGAYTYFNEDCMISCKSKINIGDGCQFGPNVKIFDNDHDFDLESGVKYSHKTAPIIIGKKCWIGSNVIILRGTRIGDKCVIGAGVIVKDKIPSCSIVTQERHLIIKPIKDSK